MEGRTKVTKEILCEEGRFILANVLAEGRFSRQNRIEDIRRICEGALTLPFAEYLGFLESADFMRHDREADSLEVTPEGARVANGDNLTDFADRAVQYFKARKKRTRDDGKVTVPVTSGGRSNATAGGEIVNARSGELIDSRYEKLATIGSGGIGTVYRARQVPLDRQVALKEIRDLFSFFSDDQAREVVRRFRDVVEASAQLAHPNIVPVHDVNLDREHPYVVSELAPNGSARRLIADAEEIPVGLAVKYLLQSLHALSAAHKLDVIHRGIKPENMLIDGYGNVKLSDFGFTRIVERDSAVIRQVYVGMGAVAYMAPELFNDPSGAGAQSDIYALGIIFYELLTRKLPGRRAPMPSEVIEGVPAALDDIFDKMTRDSTDERYSTVDAILEDFDKVEGLGDVLGQQTQVLIADNPLDAIVFRASDSDGDGEGDGGDGDGDKADTSHRPYSYQRLHKNKT